MNKKNFKQAGTIDYQQLRQCVNLMGDDTLGLRLYLQRSIQRPIGQKWSMFYHFTCQHWLPAILLKGLVKGEVPVSNTGGFEAPWLTSDPLPHRVGVARPKEMGVNPSGDKTRFRMTIKIPNGDRNLWRWLELAKALKSPKNHVEELNAAAHGDGKSWYVYLGVIPPEWIVSLEEWNGSDFHPVNRGEYF